MNENMVSLYFYILILSSLIAGYLSNDNSSDNRFIPEQDVQQAEKDGENGILTQTPVRPPLPVISDTLTPRPIRPLTSKPPPFTPRPWKPDGLGITSGVVDGIGISSGRVDGIGSDGIIRGAVSRRHRIEFFDAPVETSQITPQIIEFDGGQLPLTLRFRSASSRINIQQIHTGEDGGEERTKSEDKPYLIFHESTRPVIQEIREVITPFRRVVQQIQPVQEEIYTYVAKGKERQIIDFGGIDERTGDRRVDTDDIRGAMDGRREGTDSRRDGADDRRGGTDERRDGADDRKGGTDNRRGGSDYRGDGTDDISAILDGIGNTGTGVGIGSRDGAGSDENNRGIGTIGTKSVYERNRGTGVNVDIDRRVDFNRGDGSQQVIGGTKTLNIRESRDSEVISTGESKQRIKFSRAIENRRRIGLETPFGGDMVLVLDADQINAMRKYFN